MTNHATPPDALGALLYGKLGIPTGNPEAMSTESPEPGDSEPTATSRTTSVVNAQGETFPAPARLDIGQGDRGAPPFVASSGIGGLNHEIERRLEVSDTRRHHPYGDRANAGWTRVR